MGFLFVMIFQKLFSEVIFFFVLPVGFDSAQPTGFSQQDSTSTLNQAVSVG